MIPLPQANSPPVASPKKTIGLLGPAQGRPGIFTASGPACHVATPGPRLVLLDLSTVRLEYGNRLFVTVRASKSTTTGLPTWPDSHCIIHAVRTYDMTSIQP